MLKIHHFIMTLGLGIMGCSHSIKTDVISDQIPDNYQSVIDSIREYEKQDSNLFSEYFLYDITGDSLPELWVKLGTCEADTKLLAFTCEDGNVAKIYEGDGGHSDFFIFDNHLVSVMCNTGAGIVVTYEYDGKNVNDSSVGFSTWNDDGKALSDPHDSIADAKLGYWEDNYGNYIELKPL